MDESIAISLRVAQASGTVGVQADCSIEAAMILLESRAHMMGRTVDQLAAQVVDRTITFG
jgi:hypothetical protein